MFFDQRKESAQKKDVKIFNCFDPGDKRNFITHFEYLLHKQNCRFNKKIIFICIGSDRSTGDCLGPLIGSILLKQLPRPVVTFGSLNSPVHALNLETTITNIHKNYQGYKIVAIDACLGSRERVGFIEIGLGQIFPGSSLNKNLPPIGDIFINGIVNVGGFMDFMVLQSTRLSAVLPMARFIAQGIYEAICKKQANEDSLELLFN